MNTLFSLLYWISFFAIEKDQPLPIWCTPSVSISSAVQNLTVNKSDTIQVRIGCLTTCKPVLESEALEIQALDSGKFVIRPKKAGPAKIQILSDCPPNTSVEMGGNVMDVSGRMMVDSWTFEVKR